MNRKGGLYEGKKEIAEAWEECTVIKKDCAVCCIK